MPRPVYEIWQDLEVHTGLRDIWEPLVGLDAWDRKNTALRHELIEAIRAEADVGPVGLEPTT